MTKAEQARWEMKRTEMRGKAIKAWPGLTVSHCETIGGIGCDMVARDSAGRVVSVLTASLELRDM